MRSRQSAEPAAATGGLRAALRACTATASSRVRPARRAAALGACHRRAACARQRRHRTAGSSAWPAADGSSRRARRRLGPGAAPHRGRRRTGANSRTRPSGDPIRRWLPRRATRERRRGARTGPRRTRRARRWQGGVSSRECASAPHVRVGALSGVSDRPYEDQVVRNSGNKVKPPQAKSVWPVM